MPSILTKLKVKVNKYSEYLKSIKWCSIYRCQRSHMVYILSMLYRDDHKDVTNRKGRTWTPKPRSDLGHWNGMTVYETGKTPQVTSEIRQFNHHVLGVSESRWTGSGKIRVIAGKKLSSILWEGWLSTPWRSSHHTQKRCGSMPDEMEA